MTMNQLLYKVLNERSILVFPDNAAEARAVRRAGHPDVLSSRTPTRPSWRRLLSTIIRAAAASPVQPAISAQQDRQHDHRARRPTPVVADHRADHRSRTTSRAPRSSSTSRSSRSIATRAKQYGLNLSDYALGDDLLAGSVAERDDDARRTTTGTPATTTATGTSTPPSGVASPPPFNLNTISRGISTADFYLAVPTAIVRFLETDTQTKLIAKPQLRGAEGTKLTLNLGDEVPVISTSYTPIATGGAGVNPLSSYNYRTSASTST